MKSSLLAIRSIGAEFANRLLYPVVVAGSIIAILLVGLTLWLTTLNSWWWLLFIPITIVISVGLAVSIIIKLVIRSVRPTQTKAQKQATKQLVDKIQFLSEVTQTPKIVLLFRIVKDIAAPKQKGFISNLTTASGSLKSDFIELKRTFEK